MTEYCGVILKKTEHATLMRNKEDIKFVYNIMSKNNEDFKKNYFVDKAKDEDYKIGDFEPNWNITEKE